MWTTVSTEELVPTDHPLRSLRVIVNEVLKALLPRFSKIYSRVGRPSIAPEKLLRAMLLQVFYSICGERMLVEQLRYNTAFSLVRRLEHRRSDLGCDDVYKESPAHS